MPFKKGEIHRQGGRKTKVEEVKAALLYQGEKITQEALIALANSKVYKQMKESNERIDTKDIALPITLKGMTDKKELSGEVKVNTAMSEEDFKKMLSEYGTDKRTKSRGVITDVE
jgi:hypothetical protein